MDLELILGTYHIHFIKRKETNFIWVTANLLTAANIYGKTGKNGDADKYFNHIREYLRLLDEFPEFQEHELREGNLTTSTNALKYIEEQYKLLRKIDYEKQGKHL